MSLKVCLTVLLLSLPLVSDADVPPVRVNSPNLAQALAAVHPPADTHSPADGLVLAVGADRAVLLADAVPLDASASAAQVAQAYGDITQEFGAVTAVAPASVTALNPDPQDPNIFAGLAPEEALSLLTASLNDSQWQALTSARGLGLADLTTDNQRAFFQALFPNGQLGLLRSLTDTEKEKQYFATAASGGGPDQADAALTALDKANQLEMSGALTQAHLRLGHSVVLGISEGPGTFRQISSDNDPAAPPRWEVARDTTSPKNTLYGVLTRATLPNTPKPADLDFSRHALSAAVTVTGCRTVGELVTAIGRATGLELYADQRWESKTVSVTGTQSSAPARDLLPALALCLGGTYRRVGTAYVLTSDLTGIGTIRDRWEEFWGDAEARKTEALSEAQGQLAASHSWNDLAPTGDSLDLTAAQRKLIAGSTGAMAGVPFEQLDPTQQALIRRYAAEQQRLHTDETRLTQEYPVFTDGLPMSTAVPATLGGRVNLVTVPRLEVLFPSLSGPAILPVNMLSTSLFALPSSGSAVTGNASAAASAAAFPTLAAVLATIPRRAVLAHPTTPGEVDMLVGLMKKARMNALYLDVFSGGSSRLAGQPDILDEALTRTKGSGIAVFPTLSLFDWGDKVRDGITDLNILGETSVAAQTHDRHAAAPALLPHTLFVSPFAADVRQTLMSMIQQAGRAGIAGFVWRNAAVPGYSPEGSLKTSCLGYTDTARLAFLRRSRVDPLDVSSDFPQDLADLTLPGFDGSGADTALVEQWEAARLDAWQSLLQSLRVGGGPLPIFVERSSQITGADDWYGSWDSPKDPLPGFFPPSITAAEQQSGLSWTQAKAQSHLEMRVLSPLDLLTSGAGATLRDEFPAGRWAGFVLDADAPPSGTPDRPTDLITPLSRIVAALHTDK